MSEPIPAVPTPPVAPQTVLFDMNSLINQVIEAVKPVAVNHAEHVVALAGTVLQANISAVAADVEKNRKQIEETAASVGQSYAARLTSPRIQAFLIVGTAAIIWAGCLATWVAYLLGAPDAQGIVGWAGAAFAGSSGGLTILHQLGFLGATGTPAATTTTHQVGQVSTTTTVGS